MASLYGSTFHGMEELKDRLVRTRKEAGLSQVQLSKAAGVTQPVISDLEQGKQGGSKHIAKIAAALGVSPAWLDTGDGPKLIEPVLDPSAEPIYQELKSLSPEDLGVVLSVIRGLKQSRRGSDE